MRVLDAAGACARDSQLISVNAILKVLRRNLPDVHASIHGARRKDLNEMINKPMSPHIKAKEILACASTSLRGMCGRIYGR
jgi:hypothetical protein